MNPEEGGRRGGNRFQDFFVEQRYVAFKNHLYNYLLRKRAVEQIFAQERHDLILEVGSGISPVMTRSDRIVYSELSWSACQTLKHTHGRGWCVVADATHLPFRAEVFSHAISSEVLEHIEDDRAALWELARVTRRAGSLIVTFPHRMLYFANDDRYVKHFRRYELDEMLVRLREAGMRAVQIRKILGPLERITMMTAVVCFETLQRVAGRGGRSAPRRIPRWVERWFQLANYLYAGLAWLDARWVPRSFAAVLLIRAVKETAPPECS